MSKILAPTLLNTPPLVEEILDSHQDHARGDESGWSSYRGHVYLVFNMARALVRDTDHRDDKLAIAAAFHDIDVFTPVPGASCDAHRGVPASRLGRFQSGPYPGGDAPRARATVRTSIDVGCFFTRTVPRAIVRHLIRHPLGPLPITRARRALKQAGYGGADR
jgi:hypothetical protein